MLTRMSELEKIRTVYWHACLRYVNRDFMTNESIRKRFNIGEKNYSLASRLIAKCIEKDIIKLSDTDNKSKKYTKYVPFRAS